jgi:hypothetical protein
MLSKQISKKTTVTVKVKVTPEQATKSEKGSRGIARPYLGARWGEWSTPRSGRFNPGKETRYPLHERFGGPQVRSGRVWKI